MHRLVLSAWCHLFIGVAGATCVSTNPVSSISISPSSSTVTAGYKQQFSAIVTFSNGSTGTSASWSSSNLGVATISSSGLASTVNQGTSTITASSCGQSAYVTLTVNPPVLTSLTLSSQNVSLGTSMSTQIVLTGTYSNGASQDLTAAAQWSISNTNIVNLISPGLIYGVSVGTSSVGVSYGGLTVTCSVIVTTPPALSSISITPQNAILGVADTLGLVATGKYADGSTGDLTNEVTWTSSDPTVASLMSYMVTGWAQGSVVIGASFKGVTSSTSLSVGSAGQVSAPTIASFSPTMAPAGTTVTLSGSGFSLTSAVTVGSGVGSGPQVFPTRAPSLPFSVLSDSNIAVSIPSNTVSAPYQFTVITPSGTASSSTFFLVLTGPPVTISSFSPSSAAVGQTITVNGSNFNSQTLIQMTGKPLTLLNVTPNVVSSSQLTFQIPAGTMSGQFTVVTPGRGGVNSSPLTIVPPPIGTAPQTGPNVFSLASGPVGGSSQPISLNVLDNASFAGSSPTVSISIPPTAGSAYVDSQGNIQYTPPIWTSSNLPSSYMSYQLSDGSVLPGDYIQYTLTDSSGNSTTGDVAIQLTEPQSSGDGSTGAGNPTDYPGCLWRMDFHFRTVGFIGSWVDGSLRMTRERPVPPYVAALPTFVESAEGWGFWGFNIGAVFNNLNQTFDNVSFGAFDYQPNFQTCCGNCPTGAVSCTGGNNSGTCGCGCVNILAQGGTIGVQLLGAGGIGKLNLLIPMYGWFAHSTYWNLVTGEPDFFRRGSLFSVSSTGVHIGGEYNINLGLPTIENMNSVAPVTSPKTSSNGF